MHTKSSTTILVIVSGNNVPPFCKPAGTVISMCSTELLHADNIYANCAPVYYSSQNPATDCEGAARCRKYEPQYFANILIALYKIQHSRILRLLSEIPDCDVKIKLELGFLFQHNVCT